MPEGTAKPMPCSPAPVGGCTVLSTGRWRLSSGAAVYPPWEQGVPGPVRYWGIQTVAGSEEDAAHRVGLPRPLPPPGCRLQGSAVVTGPLREEPLSSTYPRQKGYASRWRESTWCHAGGQSAMPTCHLVRRAAAYP